MLKSRIRYEGSGHHKKHPADYGFERANPIPTKTLCDEFRPLRLAEAKALLFSGIDKGMVSKTGNDDIPNYIWSVSETGEVFEAKTHRSTPGVYHGYPLKDNDDMKPVVLKVWSAR